MRNLLALLGVIGLFCGTASAITVDGDISDWLSEVPDGVFADDTTDGCTNCEMTRWGFKYTAATQTDPGYLYWFIETTADISEYYGGAGGATEGFFGLWTDVDHYSGPISYGWGVYRYWKGSYAYAQTWSGPSMIAIHDEWLDASWRNGVHQGIDINAELGINTTGWGEGWNYWGSGDCVGFYENAIDGGSWADSGKIIEAQVPIDDLIDEIKTYPDYTNGNFMSGGKINGLWKVAPRIETVRVGGSPGPNANQDYADMQYAPIIADYNNDGYVSNSDFGVISDNFGKTGATWEEGDGNLDGRVTVGDFGFLSDTFGSYMENLGPGAGGGAVPEPVTLALLGLGGLLLRRRK
jgi:hypothetical protein